MGALEKGGVGLCSSSSSGDGVGNGGLRETKVPEMRQDSRLACSQLGVPGNYSGDHPEGAHLLATRQGYPRGNIWRQEGWVGP